MGSCAKVARAQKVRCIQVWVSKCKYPSVSIQVILAKPRAEVSKKTKKPIGSGCVTLIWTSFHLTLLLQSLLSLYFSIEISTFSLLFYWNLYFLFSFLLKSLLSLKFSIEISTFSLHLYFLYTFLWKSLLSLHFSIEISTLLFYGNLYFLFTCLWKSLLSLYFSIETSTLLSLDVSIVISTFFLPFYWNLYFLFTFLLLLSTFLLKSLLSFHFSIEISTFSDATQPSATFSTPL